MKISVNAGAESYPIFLERGGLSRAGELLKLDRKVLLVTDSGVPRQYVEQVSSCCRSPFVAVFPQGEAQKNLGTWTMLLERLVREGFTRTDCVVAVGGGVVGDMAGFAAAAYMRGIDFYNVPTTLLAQVDSSIGGKTAVDFMGYKNIVGAFYQPKAVLIDPNVLETLPPRQISNGLAEAVKMAATCNKELFEWMEAHDPRAHLEQVIAGSLQIKQRVVEQDVKEQGLRKVLNFGHTVGHAIEACCHGALYHGECVALGMLPMAASEPQKRLRALLERCGLPTEYSCNRKAVLDAMSMDKKNAGEEITVVTVPAIGSFSLDKMPLDSLKKRMEEALK